MASGLPHAQWNNGDVDDPAAVDLAEVRRWYAERGVPWGLRLPAGAQWPHGRRLFTKRLMAATAETFVPEPVLPSLRIRAADPADVDTVVGVDAIAFESPVEVERAWMRPLFGQDQVTVAVAEWGGEPVGTGYSLLTQGDGGHCLYVAGIAVLPHARRRGVAGALSSWLLTRGSEAGADLAHLHPDTDEAESVYRRLGFTHVTDLDIYVDMA